MNTDSPDEFDDPAAEEAWCEAQRGDIELYLKRQSLAHGRIGEWPAWHIPPVVSVWAVESASVPGAMGWWVISGDLPTDYLSATDAEDLREAVRAFADRWSTAAQAMREGRDSPVSIGTSDEDRRTLAPMLESRARLLRDWAERADVWSELFNDE